MALTRYSVLCGMLQRGVLDLLMGGARVVKHKPNQHVALRESEGVVVGIVQRRGAEGIGVLLDLSDAPVPDRRFSADGASVHIGPDIARIVFSQFKLIGPEVERLVVVRITFAAVKQFVDSMKHVAASASGFLDKVHNPPSPPVDTKGFAGQSVTLDANLIVAGFSGREACMDLYYSSPQAKVALNRGSSELRAEPVARVSLTTRLLMDIHDALAEKVETLGLDEIELSRAEAEHE